MYIYSQICCRSDVRWHNVTQGAHPGTCYYAMAALTQGRSLHINQRQSRERKHWSTFSYRLTWLQVAPQEEPSDPAFSPDSPCPPLAAQRAPRSEARCWVSTCQGPILTSPFGRPRWTPPVTATLANRKHNCSSHFAPTSPVQLLPPWQQPCLPLKRTEDTCRGWLRGRKHQGRVIHGLAWHDLRQCWGRGGCLSKDGPERPSQNQDVLGDAQPNREREHLYLCQASKSLRQGLHRLSHHCIVTFTGMARRGCSTNCVWVFFYLDAKTFKSNLEKSK